MTHLRHRSDPIPQRSSLMPHEVCYPSFLSEAQEASGR